MRVSEILATTVLVRSKLPDVEYVVNPYLGCEFGCRYCYASFMGRFRGERVEDWGEYVYAKVNAVELFTAELQRLQRTKRAPTILLSSVTDPYQGAEKAYRLTRGILNVLAREPYPGTVSILTKSPIVLRDVDVLHRLPCVEVGITVTTPDDRVCRTLEVRAPPASVRLRALRELHSEGIATYAFVGPLLPHFVGDPQSLDLLFGNLARAGVRYLYVEHINLRPHIRKRLWPTLEHEPSKIRELYHSATSSHHHAALDAIVANLVEKHNLKLRSDEVLVHDQRCTS